MNILSPRGPVLALALALPALACKSTGPGAATETADAAAPTERLVKFDAQALERLGVRSQVVGEENARLTVEFPGSLEYAPEHYAEVGTLFEGRLTSANVKVGDRVHKGQVLATIAAPSLVNAQAEAISTKAAAEVAREHARRESKLLEAQLTTAREAEVAREGLVRAEADYNAATAKLALVGLGPTRGGATYGVAELRAPIDGVVVKREAIVGAHINTDETPFIVADGTVLVAAFDVFEGDLALVKENAEVELRVDALPGKILKGTVARLEPQLGTETRAVRARVRLSNEEGLLRPGLFVRVTVSAHIEQVAGRLRVPSGAVQPLGSEEVVFIERQPGVYEVRPVTVGHRYGQVSELLSGLGGGERIVTGGAFILRSELSRQ
jgi:cobalt-zinc-cadmium efflux system membrane fusion protein